MLRAALLLGALVVASWAPLGAFAQAIGLALRATEQPLAPEANPPGDIPDTQVFVAYESPLGYRLEVPEGWARSATGNTVSFVDKFDRVAVELTDSPTPPTAATVAQDHVPALEKSGHAVRVGQLETVKLPAGPTVRIAYTSNSAPNAVTNKAVRLENEQYLFWKEGKLATLTLSAPSGADNADQWRYMAEHFRWQ